MSSQTFDSLTHVEHFTDIGRMKLFFYGPGEFIKLPKNPEILDAGCSGGISTYELKEIFPDAKRVVGIDRVNPNEIYKSSRLEKAIANYREKFPAGVDFKQMDMFNIDESIGEFDLILMANNIFHKLFHGFRDKDHYDTMHTLAMSLKSACNRLKEHGYLVLLQNHLDEGYYILIAIQKVNGKFELLFNDEILGLLFPMKIFHLRQVMKELNEITDK